MTIFLISDTPSSPLDHKRNESSQDRSNRRHFPTAMSDDHEKTIFHLSVVTSDQVTSWPKLRPRLDPHTAFRRRPIRCPPRSRDRPTTPISPENHCQPPASLRPENDPTRQFSSKQSIFHDGQSIFRSEQSIFHDEQSIVRNKQSIFRDGKSIFRSKQSIFHDGQSIFRSKQSIFRDEKSIVRGKPSIFHDGESIVRSKLSIFRDGKSFVRARGSSI